MRALVVSEHWPWPQWTGARQRIGLVVDALAEICEVDFFHIDRQWPGQIRADDPRPGLLARWTHQPLAGQGRPAPRWLPAGLAAVSGRAEQPLREWAGGRAYDIVWCNRESGLAAADAALPGAPLAVDIDDLGEVVERRMRDADKAPPPGLRHLADLRRRLIWRRVHRRTLRRASVGLVCSELDRRHLAAPNVRVIPNVSTIPVKAPAPRPADREPALLFQGLFTYAPNEQAARLLATEILPRVRAEVPGARALLVGHHGGLLDDLGRLDGVVVTGAVDDIAGWIAEADVAAVPLLVGGGTRIKILEVARRGVPVVATPVAAEGLDLVDGEHALIRQDHGSFAAACVELLRSPSRRLELAARAQQHVLSGYRPAVVRELVRRTVLEAVRRPPAAEGEPAHHREEFR